MLGHYVWITAGASGSNLKSSTLNASFALALIQKTKESRITIPLSEYYKVI